MDGPNHLSRRTALRTVGGVLAASLVAGCSAESGNGNGSGNEDGDGNGETTTTTTTTSGPAATAAVGPDGQFVFEPESVTVPAGGTVRWTFESPGHNLAAWPDMHEEISIPDGAEGFGTMAQDGNAYELVDQGETFEHTFETPGEHVYVCMPHVAQGMVGTIVVE